METQKARSYIGIASENGCQCLVAFVAGNYCQELATFRVNADNSPVTIPEMSSSKNFQSLVRAILCHHLSRQSSSTLTREQGDQLCQRFQVRFAATLTRDFWRLSTEEIDSLLDQIS